MVSTISINDDVIDSRDLIDVFDTFDNIREELGISEEFNVYEASEMGILNDTSEEKYDEFVDEVSAIGFKIDECEKLIELYGWSLENAPEHSDGQMFINKDYFTEYCEGFLKDVGYISDDLPDWIVINWEETADNMAEDYIDVDIMDMSFFTRA